MKAKIAQLATKLGNSKKDEAQPCPDRPNWPKVISGAPKARARAEY